MRPILLTLLLCASVAAETYPTRAAMYVDFENSTNGTAITPTILNAATHGGNGTWTNSFGSADAGTISTSAQMNLPSAITVAGSTYTDASGTRGMRFDYNVASWRVWAYSFTTTSHVARVSFLWRTDITPTDGATVISIADAAEQETLPVHIRAAGIYLWAGGASIAYSLNHTYLINLTYTGTVGGSHILEVCETDGTSCSQITYASGGSHIPAVLRIGRPGADGGILQTGTVDIDNLALDYSTPTVYTVKAAGGGNFTTIQACANVAEAGESCVVHSGTYAEYVSLPTSGTEGNPITFSVDFGDSVSVLGFTATSKNYITIGGPSRETAFEITDSALSASRPYCVHLTSTSHITVQYNYIHECGTGQAIRLALSNPSSYTTIRGNVIAWPAAHPAPPCASNCGDGAAGILVNGDHTLVENNDISHVTDFLTVFGSYNVVRNNTLHNVSLADFPSTTDQMHVDAVQSYTSALASDLVHLLVEGNTVYDSTTPNSHAWLFQNDGATSHGVIIRGNSVRNLGSNYLYADTGGMKDIKDYNNTVVTINTNQAQSSLASFLSGATGAAMINNLYYDTVANASKWFNLDGTTTATFTHRNNLGYISACGAGCTYTDPFNSESGVVKNTDPLLADVASNLRLQSESLARGAGTYLTTVAASDTSTGTSLVVTDAGYFQDGSGIVDADYIRVGSTNFVQIASIDYATNTITLTGSIPRSDGDGVYLYRNSSGVGVLSGENPDIGAYQYAAPPPPTTLRGTVRGATIK